MAIAREHRRKGLAVALFENLLLYNENEEVRIINSDTACTPFKKFAPGLGQYEMIMKF